MYTGPYECFEIFARPKKDKKAYVTLKMQDGSAVESKELSHIYGNWIRFSVKKESTYTVETENAEVAFAYLSEREDILEHGIGILDIADGYREIKKADFRSWIRTPYREQYHFSPVVNWINDPNGLCWFKGYYHLYYQFNPFGQEWNNMYWGHAASKDLVHWTHLPVVLGPQEEILDDLSIKGGAFSGSALPQEDEVLFYLTRHIGPQEEGWDTIQYQTMTRSKDMIHFEPEVEIIREKPEGTNYDFRDPKAGKFGDKWNLVLGACVNGKGSILLYESEDKEHWTYKCPLITEETPIRTVECPDFFPLDDTYVAMGAWMSHFDEGGRFQQCRYYVGDWQGEGMDVKAQQWVDFGSNCYAAQTFRHEDRRILIGWISDFYNEHVQTEHGAYGSMTIPRELHVKDNHVYTRPVKEIYSLREQKLFDGEMKSLELKEIADNRYYAKVSFERPCDVCMTLGECEEDGKMKSIALIAKDGKVSFDMKGVKSEIVQFPSCVKELRNAEIFVDGRTVEIYLNDGEDVGTRLFYNSNTNGIFRLESTEPARTEVHTMNSAW